MKALVLSGGGCKGAYQVGALKKWMLEDGNDYDILCGVSVGAINSSFLAQATLGDPKDAWTKLSEMWATVTTEKVKKNWFPLGVLESIWKPSIYNSSPLQTWIKSGLNGSAIALSGRKLRVSAVSWDTGELTSVTETTPNIADWVIASSAFPVMLSPIEINGQTWSDGGIRNVTPLGDAIKLGADEIDVIICSDPYAADPFTPDGSAAIPGYLLRALDLMSDQIMRADLQICGLKNNLSELKPEYKNVKIRVLEPSKVLTTNSLDFTPALISSMIETGYSDAVKLSSSNS